MNQEKNQESEDEMHLESEVQEYNAPILTPEEVSQYLLTFYGINAMTIEQLIGYDSANFYIEDVNDCPILFKVIACTNPLEICEFLEHQVNLMSSIASELPHQLIQEILDPKVKQSDSKVIKIPVRCQKYKELTNEHFHYAVAAKFVPGKTMAFFLPCSMALLENMGLKFGMLSKILQNHGDEVVWARRNHKWDPKNVLFCQKLLAKLPAITTEQREMCLEFFDRYSKVTLPFIQDKCRAGLIHSDGNCNNLLVNPERPEEVCTILDFEDACSSYIVFECGSLLMYSFCYMIQSDFSQIGAHVMKGFCREQPLTEHEWSVLVDTVIARTIQSSIYGMYGAILNPENAEYILESQKESWQLLKVLSTCDRELMAKSWRHLCDDE